MAPQDEDPPWENEFAATDENAETRVDGREAVPDPVPAHDTTGKYKTLPGFADAVEQAREHYLALGEIRGLKKAFTTLKLIRIGAGDHPARADDLVEKFKQWMIENEELIRTAMEDD